MLPRGIIVRVFGLAETFNYVRRSPRTAEAVCCAGVRPDILVSRGADGCKLGELGALHGFSAEFGMDKATAATRLFCLRLARGVVARKRKPSHLL